VVLDVCFDQVVVKEVWHRGNHLSSLAVQWSFL
jgi:hypothetical protein